MSLCQRFASVVCRLSTIHKKFLSSLNSYPISIMFGLFQIARACALNFLTDFRNFNYLLTYDLIKTQLMHSVHNSQEMFLLPQFLSDFNSVWFVSVLLAQFSLYVHKGGLKPDSFHFIFLVCLKELGPMH